MKSTNSPQKGFRRELLILVIIVGVVALLLNNRGRVEKPRVTISGLTLNMTTSEVEERLGSPDFRSRAYGAYIMEYWESEDRPQLLVWSQDEVVYKIEGGAPEIDGKTVGSHDLKQIVHLLGPPQNGGSGGEVGESGHNFLSYPQQRLLVQRNGPNTKFLLFKSGRE